MRRVLGVAFGLGLGLGLGLRSALDEGVRAMKETEAELRGKVLGSSN